VPHACHAAHLCRIYGYPLEIQHLFNCRNQAACWQSCSRQPCFWLRRARTGVVGYLCSLHSTI
jgi:hypothetical protein